MNGENDWVQNAACGDTIAGTRTGRSLMATKTKSTSNVTSDHDQIRSWAEERKAKPACVRGTGNQGDIGIIRLDFPGYSGEDKLEHISWEDWFAKFEEGKLALVYQEETAGGQKSNFNKLVSRDNVDV
jgi:hypothetical protein